MADLAVHFAFSFLLTLYKLRKRVDVLDVFLGLGLLEAYLQHGGRVFRLYILMTLLELLMF